MYSEEIDLEVAFKSLVTKPIGDNLHGIILKPKNKEKEEQLQMLAMPKDFKKKAEGANHTVNIPDGEVHLLRLVRVGNGDKAKLYKEGDIVQIIPKAEAEFQPVIGDPKCVLLSHYDITANYTKKVEIQD